MTSDTSKQHHDTPVDTADAPGGFSSLPLDVISTHILRSDFLPEPGDLGRLRAVSRGMRDAVDATGREIKKLSDMDAAHLGYVSLLKDRHSRGLLEDEYLVCGAAARSGQLEELKALRAKNFPWNLSTCQQRRAATSTCASENGCPSGGHLEVLKWARENGWPQTWDMLTCAETCWESGGERPATSRC